MKIRDCRIEQFRAGKLVRTFEPSGDEDFAWRMSANGKHCARTHGWALSKVLPTLVDGSPIMTKVVPSPLGAV